jgi:hypothetical protein
MRTRKRYEILACAFITLLLGAWGSVQANQIMPRSWATVLVGDVVALRPNTSVNRLREALDGLTLKDGTGAEVVKEGAYLPLARFTTADGQQIEVTLIQGSFSKKAISPETVWTAIGKKLVLVDSVDQYESTETDPLPVDHDAMAWSANPGCAVTVKSEPLRTLDPGETDLHPCRGPYSNEGIDWIENLAIITYGAQGTAEPCYEMADQQSPRWNKCKDHLTMGLNRVFADVGAIKPQTSGIVFPAIATGQGGLNKQDFYSILIGDVLKPRLSSKRGSAGLSHIYLRVDPEKWRSDPKNETQKWFDTRRAISEQLGALVDYWSGTEHTLNTDWSSIGGVCLAVGALLFVVVVRSPRSLLWVNLDGLYNRSTFLIVTAWVCAALGVLKTLDAIMAHIPTTAGALPRLAIAFLAAFSLIPISRISNQVEQITKEQTVHPGQAGSSDGEGRSTSGISGPSCN